MKLKKIKHNGATIGYKATANGIEYEISKGGWGWNIRDAKTWKTVDAVATLKDAREWLINS